ncbi:MAG: Gfo/Idh/MocA family protein [Limisphaerales bacterium]
MKRRQFIKRVAQGAAMASTSAWSAGRILGANERVNVAWIGCGGRGRHVAGLMRQVSQVDFIAVCDVYDAHAAAAREWAGGRSTAFRDFRKVLELKDVDAVLIATPDHWHAIPTVLACQAGKDVYVEKPLAHNIKDGRAMVAAARRHDRVVQMGAQQRSAPHYAEAARIIQSGALGPVHFVRIWNYTNMFPNGIGRVPDADPPEGVDWDMYLGPAPYVPFNRNRFVGTYRWFWDYGGGLVTDFGVHRFDSLHQVMGVDAPLTVSAAGRRYELNDGAETPDVVQVTYEYPGLVLSYEACMLNAHGAGGRTPGKAYYQARGQDDRPHGEAFYGASGTLISDRLGFEVYPELAGASGPGAAGAKASREGYRMERKEVSAVDATGLHVKNFIECVRSRKRPATDVEIGHRSTIVAHLGNIAYRTGRKIRWDAAAEEILDDPEASKLLGRPARKPWDLI